MKITLAAVVASLLATGNGQHVPTSEYQFIRTQQDSKRSLSVIAEDFHAMNKAREYDVYSGRYDVCSDRDEMGPCTQNFNKKYASLLEEILEHKDSNKPLHQVVDSHEEGNLIRGIAMAAYYMYSPLQTTDDPQSLDGLKRRIHNSGIRDCFYDATKSYYHEIDERFVVNVHNVKEAGNFELKGIRFNDVKRVHVKERFDSQYNIKIQDLSMVLDDCHKHGKTDWHPTGTQSK